MLKTVKICFLFDAGKTDNWGSYFALKLNLIGRYDTIYILLDNNFFIIN